MKTEIGVGAAVLAALAAEGKDFDRAELNAMLDKLAARAAPSVPARAAGDLLRDGDATSSGVHLQMPEVRCCYQVFQRAFQ